MSIRTYFECDHEGCSARLSSQLVPENSDWTTMGEVIIKHFCPSHTPKPISLRNDLVDAMANCNGNWDSITDAALDVIKGRVKKLRSKSKITGNYITDYERAMNDVLKMLDE